MKAFILAGGLGTRLSEETINRPKPMVEIGGRPILWHTLNNQCIISKLEAQLSKSHNIRSLK
jgi:NDP-sugar pyrophosphorylase family protein